MMARRTSTYCGGYALFAGLDNNLESFKRFVGCCQTHVLT